MRHLAYCASPYSSGNLGFERNIENAITLARYTFLAGHNPVSPIENYKHLEFLSESGRMDRQKQEREALELCLDLLAVCPVLILAPNWATSSGARIEKRLGLAMSKTILCPTIEMIREKGLFWHGNERGELEGEA